MYRNVTKDRYFDMFLEHPDHPNWEMRVGMLGNDFTFIKALREDPRFSDIARFEWHIVVNTTSSLSTK